MTHIAFFSGDITRSGGTENVSIMVANALVAGASGEDASGAPASGANPGIANAGIAQSKNPINAPAFDEAPGIEDPVSDANLGNARSMSANPAGARMRLSFVSLFEEADEPFFPIDACIARHTVYAAPTHGIHHYFGTVRRLRRIVEREHVDVLVDIDGILDMYALPLKRATGVKVVSWEHFNYLQHPGVPYRRLTRRWAARRADAIVTLTEADKAMYLRHLTPRCPVIAIPNPMRTPSPAPVYDAASTIIVSSGRLTHQKGFDMLVDVAARVLPAHPDWCWLILGEGEDRPMLEERIARAGLDGQLILRGRVDDMDGHYRRAAMFVLTSRFEGLPMVLLEAKAHRLPIVSFDCATGPAEIVTDGVNGDLTAVGDVEAMAARINRLIDDAALRRVYADHALDDAARFGMDGILGQWRALFARLDGAGADARGAGADAGPGKDGSR